MKRLLVVIIALSLCLLQAGSVLADALIYETFDDWKNPNIANGWTAHAVGGWGGEFNQIYEAAQEMICGIGESSYYRSIYKDFAVTQGKVYSVTFDYLSSAEWHAWLQFYDANNQLLSTAGNSISNYPYSFLKGYVPTQITGHGRHYTPIWGQGAVAAPNGASRARLVFQAHAQAPAGSPVVVAVRNVVLYEAQEAGIQDGITQFTYAKVAGPFINRNTEFTRGVNEQFGTYTFGTLSGEYKSRPIGGSSQGISSGGTFNDYRSMYRDFAVTPGVKYQVTVDVVSNSTNEKGSRTPSPVRIWLQYNGIGYDGRETVLSTHGIDGTQGGIKDNEWTTVTVPGNGNVPYTMAPEKASRARIILQVMGGTGGGTIFDNVSLTRYEQ